MRKAFALSVVMLAVLSAALSAGASGVVSSCTEASLRAALIGGGQVTFSSDCTISISQQIVIGTADTTIDASTHNVVITASNSVPLFLVATNLVLRGLSLMNGQSTNAGAALHIQPGVTVIARQCVFAANSVVASNGVAGINGTTNSSSIGDNGSDGTSGASAFGGAIYNLGNLALVNCVLANNVATGGSGGSGGAGGSGAGTFAIPGNGGNGGAGGAGFGGAVYNLGNLTLVNCTFSGNSATAGDGGTGGAAGAGSYSGFPGNGGMGGAASGGAVFNANNLTVIASAFSTNFARGGTSAMAGTRGNGNGMDGLKGGAGSGGALYNAWWATITNSTFFTNTVFGGDGGNGGAGGGTFVVPGNGGDGGDAIGGALANVNTITLISCTFSTSAAFGGTNGVAGAGNFTANNGAIGNSSGGNIANSGGALTLMNSILTGSPSGLNVFGSLTDAGHNLSSDAVGSFGASSFQKTDPRLGALAFNGGPTPTMALLANSPAIDRIPPDESPPTDQRGFPRPHPTNGLADIGAFELGAAASATNVVLAITQGANGVVQLSGAGTAGLTYFVQSSTNLTSWQTISTNLAPIQFSDPTTNASARFYRLIR